MSFYYINIFLYLQIFSKLNTNSEQRKCSQKITIVKTRLLKKKDRDSILTTGVVDEDGALGASAPLTPGVEVHVGEAQPAAAEVEVELPVLGLRLQRLQQPMHGLRQLLLLLGRLRRVARAVHRACKTVRVLGRMS